jgi:hypothetical protein
LKRLVVLLLLSLMLMAAACSQSDRPSVQIILSSGQCTPQTLTLRRDITYRVTFLNQDPGGASWDLYLNVPSKERPNLSTSEPSLVLSAKAQQNATGLLTPRTTGQFEYTCVTETRTFVVRTGVVNVTE